MQSENIQAPASISAFRFLLSFAVRLTLARALTAVTINTAAAGLASSHLIAGGGGGDAGYLQNSCHGNKSSQLSHKDWMRLSSIV